MINEASTLKACKHYYHFSKFLGFFLSFDSRPRASRWLNSCLWLFSGYTLCRAFDQLHILFTSTSTVIAERLAYLEGTCDFLCEFEILQRVCLYRRPKEQEGQSGNIRTESSERRWKVSGTTGSSVRSNLEISILFIYFLLFLFLILFTESFYNLGAVHTTLEEFQNGAFILKTYQMFSSPLRRGNFLNATIPGHFGFVVEENMDREITWISRRHCFLKAPS